MVQWGEVSLGNFSEQSQWMNDWNSEIEVFIVFTVKCQSEIK